MFLEDSLGNVQKGTDGGGGGAGGGGGGVRGGVEADKGVKLAIDKLSFFFNGKVLEEKVWG